MSDITNPAECYALLSRDRELVAVAHWDITNTAPPHDHAAFDAFAEEIADDFFDAVDASLARIQLDASNAK